MTDSHAPQIADERYINLESFRKDGSGVKTPVWCAPLDGTIVVFSESKAYKVKRVRNNPKVRIAACDVRGSVRGPWIDGECRVVDDPAWIKRARAALRTKYGWQSWIADVGATIVGRLEKRAYLEITVSG